jgi:biopolymer transport protein ExbB/TolQ
MGTFEIIEATVPMSPTMRAVILVLLFMSIYTIAFGIERLIVIYKAKKQSDILVRMIGKLLHEGKIEDSIDAASDKKFKNSCLAKILVAGLNELEFRKDSNTPYAEKEKFARRAMERAAIKGLVKFKKRLSGLASIGSTSVFVGLFGTLFGLITTFQCISFSGHSGYHAVAEGLSQALITTAFGIVVAVIAVMFFNFLSNKVDIFAGEMANASSELIDNYIKKNIPFP